MTLAGSSLSYKRIFASGFDLHLSRPISAEEIDVALRDRLRKTA